MNKIIMVFVIMMVLFVVNVFVLLEIFVLFKSGIGVIDNDIVYIGLGSVGMVWYKLDIQVKDKKWIALAVFFGGLRD